MKTNDKLITVNPLINFCLVLGKIIRKERNNEIMINEMKMGLNKVKEPFVTNESYVYIRTLQKSVKGTL